jgi:UPF0755 protein
MTLTRRGRVVTVVGIIVGFFTVVLLAAYIYGRSIGVMGSSNPGRLVSIVIPEGSSASEIGEVLADHDVVRSALGFRIAAWLNGGADKIQAGRYEVPTGLTAADALDELLERGPVLEVVMVTFPEGSWLTDFADILEHDTDIAGRDFLHVLRSGRVTTAVVSDPASFEGLLFPSTYEISEKDTALTVAQRFADEFEERVSAIDFSSVDAMGYSRYEAVIVASMVEAEAKVPSDRAKIAAVIYNRLEEGIPLQIDATVLYALGEHKTELTTSDLAVDSPYNTRIVTGLPPTPIGAPGEASLEAAATPARGDWLYYVLSDCAGHHAFSVDYQGFLADKAAYQALDC